MAGIQFSLDWQGYRGPGGRFSSRAQQHLGHTLDALAEGLETRLRAEAPISDAANVPPGRRPGELRRGIQVTHTQHGHQGRLEAVSEASYTGYVRRGHDEVVARPGKRLRFFYRGRWVYARRVRAVPPNDFVGRAVDGYEPHLRTELGRLVGRLTSAFLDAQDS
jgi:hypothetical protein